MKREFLEGLELEKETIDSIMAEYGKALQGVREEKENLKTQLENANNEIQSYKDMDIESIKQSASNWEEKYNNLIQEQKDAQARSIREERVNAFFNDVKFASTSAKKGVISEFDKMDFKYDENSKKFIGANEWLEDYKKNDVGAFLSVVANPKFTTAIKTPTETITNDEIRKAMGLK